jgi:hypothetical protein
VAFWPFFEDSLDFLQTSEDPTPPVHYPFSVCLPACQSLTVPRIISHDESLVSCSYHVVSHRTALQLQIQSNPIQVVVNERTVGTMARPPNLQQRSTHLPLTLTHRAELLIRATLIRDERIALHLVPTLLRNGLLDRHAFLAFYSGDTLLCRSGRLFDNIGLKGNVLYLGASLRV